MNNIEELENEIKVWYDGKEYLINKNDLNDKKTIPLSKVDKQKEFISVLKLKNGKKICTYIDSNKGLTISNNINSFYKLGQKTFVKVTKKNVYFYGLIINKSNEDLDNIFFNDEYVGRVIRPFKFGYFKKFAIIKIPTDLICKSTEFHSDVSVGKNKDISITLKNKKKKGKDDMKYYAMKIVNDKVIIIRSTLNSGSIKITKLDLEPEYLLRNRIKNNIARFIAKIIGKKDIVLLFEKSTKRAEESGFHVFEKIIEKNFKKTKAYFILDKNNKNFDKIKEKYKDKLVKKYSFRHYLYIYISKYFIASELSNHVMNTRIYIKSLKEAINKKPLIYLHHGILFSKPIENPTREGFYKNKSQINIYKCTVCSELEKGQHYIMGYDDNDLIKCGLAKLDISYMNKDADKILFVLTYRDWEEGMTKDKENILKTTYYKSYMNVIKAFERANMLDKFRVSCHPKFKEVLTKAAPEYSNIIENDLTEALKNTRIIITDYSSVSLDAHYRGAYVIYYWAERDYLLEHYVGKPALTEETCDGVPVYSTDELIEEVKRAIEKNYKLDEKYEERYRKINEFHDGKNTERLINELIKLKVLN